MGLASGREALNSAVESLTTAGIGGANEDAQRLVAEVLDVEVRDLTGSLAEPLAAGHARRLRELVERRSRGEPLAYLLGWVEFRGLRLRVDSRVVVPCDPPTGSLVDVALALPEGARVVDVGTGSGAVALSIKHERPDLAVMGSDASGDAVAVARTNAELLSLDVTFETISGIPRGRFDLVLTNPPYARDDEVDVLASELSSHQPALALFGGVDGLDVLRSIVATAEAGTRLATEHDRAQTGAVHALLSDALTRDDPHTTSSVTVGVVA